MQFAEAVKTRKKKPYGGKTAGFLAKCKLRLGRQVGLYGESEVG